MPSWPRGKGPIVGQCPHCRMAIRIKWSSKVARETYCMGCGQVNVQKSVRTVLTQDALRVLLDEVWTSLHKKEARLQPFLRTVHEIAKQRHGVGVGRIHKSQLEKWGYVVSDEWIKRV